MPFDEVLEPYFALLGYMTYSYAMLEHGISVAIVAIHHHHGGRAIKKELPRTQFQRKIEYLRAVAPHIPAIGPNLAGVMNLADRAEAVAKDRQLFIHGTPTDFHAEGAVTMNKLDVTKLDNLFEITDRKVTFAELTAIADEASGLANFALDFASHMIRDDQQQLIKHSRGKDPG